MLRIWDIVKEKLPGDLGGSETRIFHSKFFLEAWRLGGREKVDGQKWLVGVLKAAIVNPIWSRPSPKEKKYFNLQKMTQALMHFI